MLIVDSQIHIWGANLPANPAHRQITSYTAETCFGRWTRPAWTRR